MSRIGNCLDNVVMEYFFGILKSEMFYINKIKSNDSFQKEIVDYIDYYTNNDRIKQKSNGLTPIQYRTQAN